jgi:hypothetical protein
MLTLSAHSIVACNQVETTSGQEENVLHVVLFQPTEETLKTMCQLKMHAVYESLKMIDQYDDGNPSENLTPTQVKFLSSVPYDMFHKRHTWFLRFKMMF